MRTKFPLHFLELNLKSYACTPNKKTSTPAEAHRRMGDSCVACCVTANASRQGIRSVSQDSAALAHESSPVHMCKRRGLGTAFRIAQSPIRSLMLIVAPQAKIQMCASLHSFNLSQYNTGTHSKAQPREFTPSTPKRACHEEDRLPSALPPQSVVRAESKIRFWHARLPTLFRIMFTLLLYSPSHPWDSA